jgi:dihydrofolate reductase
VIGGADIFELFEPSATRIEMTEMHEDTDGDVAMPYPGAGWREIAREERAARARAGALLRHAGAQLKRKVGLASSR